MSVSSEDIASDLDTAGMICILLRVGRAIKTVNTC